MAALADQRTDQFARAQPRASMGVEDASSSFIEAQIKGIIGIEIRIQRMEGKWKVSQNRNSTDRAGVQEGPRSLGESGEAMPASCRTSAAPGKARSIRYTGWQWLLLRLSPRSGALSWMTGFGGLFLWR